MDAPLQRRYGVELDTEAFAALRERTRTTLLQYNEASAAVLANELADRLYPLAFLYLEVIVPELMRITEEWHRQERPFSDVGNAWEQLGVILSVLRRRAIPTPSRTASVLVACVEGNRHELGPHLLADLLAESGFPVTYLPVPTERATILDETLTRNPACIALSVSMPKQYEELFDTADALRDRGYPGIIAAGGYPLDRHPLPGWQHHGIDWTGTDALDFIAWLERETGEMGEAA